MTTNDIIEPPLEKILGGILVYSKDKHQEIIESSHKRCKKYLLSRDMSMCSKT
jgi:hypothetical protein